MLYRARGTNSKFLGDGSVLHCARNWFDLREIVRITSQLLAHGVDVFVRKTILEMSLTPDIRIISVSSQHFIYH